MKKDFDSSATPEELEELAGIMRQLATSHPDRPEFASQLINTAETFESFVGLVRECLPALEQAVADLNAVWPAELVEIEGMPQ